MQLSAQSLHFLKNLSIFHQIFNSLKTWWFCLFCWLISHLWVSSPQTLVMDSGSAPVLSVHCHPTPNFGPVVKLFKSYIKSLYFTVYNQRKPQLEILQDG